jgi:hypothetical protein
MFRQNNMGFCCFIHFLNQKCTKTRVEKVRRNTKRNGKEGGEVQQERQSSENKNKSKAKQSKAKQSKANTTPSRVRAGGRAPKGTQVRQKSK